MLINICIIAQVIKEIRAPWLVEDCVIYRYDHFAKGDYNRGANFKNGCPAFLQSFRGGD